MPNQEDRRVSKIVWSMVSKAADRSRRQRQEIFREPMDGVNTVIMECSFSGVMYRPTVSRLVS